MLSRNIQEMEEFHFYLLVKNEILIFTCGQQKSYDSMNWKNLNKIQMVRIQGGCKVSK
jgi:hypothetical protein